MNTGASKSSKLAIKQTLISVIIPMMNEEENVREIYLKLREVFSTLSGYTYEFIYVDDGSLDASVANVQAIEAEDKAVRLLRLARNFGKEIATTAGLHHSQGQAAIMIDADMQHPPELIPVFLKKWRDGFDVVIGRQKPSSVETTFIKRITSRWFYHFMNTISSVEITPHATDFRLLDRSVIDEFNRFTERNRMTRGLIDWLGFSRSYVEFVPNKRSHGVASYTYKALIKLAADSIISLSFFPLRIAGYLGVFIVVISGPLAVFIFFNRYFMHNSFSFSGSAILAVMLLFLVGIVLICLGLIALYIANIYGEVVNRPLYVEKRREERE
jgi:glycosyltransferase involved in cell wall biosynthesis